MLVDDVTISVSAGHGGRGAVAFNKTLMSLGPVGGSGGRGGNVYAEGVSDLSVLNQFRLKKNIDAQNGLDGRDQFRDGYDGKDSIIQVPVGTTITKTDSNRKFEVVEVGERVLLARGGDGGRGNFLFRSSTHTTPKKFEYGKKGQEFELRLELRFIADIGFVGFSNVGKSSLLNELTNAGSRTGNYYFTTLEPNLGVYYELILADVPGLIEGSSEGKGLGIKFLRHIERTGIIFHFVSSESPDPERDYKLIRKELGAYKKELLEKPEHLFLTKSDMVSPEEFKEKLEALKKIDPKAMAISIHDYDSIEEVKKILNKIKDKKIKG